MGDAELAGVLQFGAIAGFLPEPGDRFEIVDVGGSAAGEFEGLGEADIVGTFGDENLFITYTGGDGNDVEIVAKLFSADFDLDDDVDDKDLDVWEAAFGVSARGDADGDGDSDGADFLVWQQQLGSARMVVDAAVPEPGAIVLTIMAVAGWSCAGARGNATHKRSSAAC